MSNKPWPEGCVDHLRTRWQARIPRAIIAQELNRLDCADRSFSAGAVAGKANALGLSGRSIDHNDDIGQTIAACRGSGMTRAEIARKLEIPRAQVDYRIATMMAYGIIRGIPRRERDSYAGEAAQD